MARGSIRRRGKRSWQIRFDDGVDAAMRAGRQCEARARTHSVSLLGCWLRPTPVRYPSPLRYPYQSMCAAGLKSLRGSHPRRESATSNLPNNKSFHTWAL